MTPLRLLRLQSMTGHILTLTCQEPGRFHIDKCRPLCSARHDAAKRNIPLSQLLGIPVSEDIFQKDKTKQKKAVVKSFKVWEVRGRLSSSSEVGIYGLGVHDLRHFEDKWNIKLCEATMSWDYMELAGVWVRLLQNSRKLKVMWSQVRV